MMGRRAPRIAVAIASVAALTAGLWGLSEWRPFAYNWPSQWDPRVAKLADYVERHAGFKFEHAVRSRFLKDAEFEKLVTTDEADLTKDDRDYYESTGLLLRTLGLASGKVDLFADQNTLNAGGILAYYSPEDREMVIRLGDAKASDELSPALRGVVVHELTHALQDQRFGLSRMRERANDDGRAEAIDALIEGHALSVEESYVSDNFSDEERQQYDEGTSADESNKEMKAVPQSVTAQQLSPYAFGPVFVKALEARGKKALVDAFLKKQPTSLEQIVLPSKYFNHDNPEEIDLPDLPKKAKVGVAGQISQLDLFFLLSRTWGAPEALRLSDLWGNGAYVGYRVGGKFCASMNIRGDDASSTDELRQAFGEWVKSPDRRSAKVTAHDGHFTVSTCDPGPDAKIDLPTEDDTNQIFWRAGDITYIARSEPNADAECVATGLYTEFETTEFDTNPKVIDRYNELIGSCRRD